MQKPGLFGMNGFIVFLLICFSFAAHAQQPAYLILIDAENKQPFTVRVGDQLYSSSSHGHLVLSQLKDSIYKLNLRFSRMNSAERVFHVPVHQKDLGFQLSGADTTWVLFNWQTKETIHSIYEKDSTRLLDQGAKREDGFSRLMAAVVNDTSVMYTTFIGHNFGKDTILNQNLKPLPVPVIGKAGKAKSIKDNTAQAKKGKLSGDSLTAVIGQSPTANSQPPTAIGQPPTANSQPPTANGQPPLKSTTGYTPRIKKIREVALKISRKIVFLDIGANGQTDTITVFVYYEKADEAGKKQIAAEPAPVIKKPQKQDSLGVSTGSSVKNQAAGSNIVPGCGQMATDADQEFLRSVILKSNTENEKIALASGAFALKCFSVGQVRILAGLFVSDKARYRLMEAAQKHVADPDHFRELADMYTDKNFRRKFLVLADKRT